MSAGGQRRRGERSGPRPRAGARRWALSLGTTVLILVICEGVARIGYRPAGAPAESAESTTEEAWSAPALDTGWVRRPDFAGLVYSTERSFDDRGLFPLDARGLAEPHQRLILAVGDSRTFGVGVRAEETWVERLQGQLPETEVVNLGVPGYSAWQGREALLRALERQELRRPDGVIFAFGFNDRRYVLRPDDADGAARFARLARRARWLRLLGRSAFLARVARATAQTASGREAAALDLAAVYPRLPPTEYRGQLDAVIDLCASRGIPLVLLWMPDDPGQTRDLRAGLHAAAAGDAATATAALQQAVAADNTFSDAARLELAKLLENEGRSADARTARTSPRRFRSLAGGYPILADELYGAATRETARVRATPLVDAGTALEAEPGVFLDFVHFDARGHQIVAALLAKRLGGG